MEVTLLPLTSLVDLGPLNQLIDMGGPVMYALIGMVIIGAITFVYLMLFGALYAPRLTRRLRKLIDQWQVSPDRTDPKVICSSLGPFRKTNPLVYILVNSMTAYQNNAYSEASREVAIRDAQATIEPFEAPLKIIEVIAALAPLLGLLGTVMGMMEAFNAMAITESQTSASQLSGGIYEALTTTAAGLIVAIPFAALAAWIEFRLRRMNKMLDHVLVSIFSIEPAVTSTDNNRSHTNEISQIHLMTNGGQEKTHSEKSRQRTNNHKEPVNAAG